MQLLEQCPLLELEVQQAARLPGEAAELCRVPMPSQLHRGEGLVLWLPLLLHLLLLAAVILFWA